MSGPITVFVFSVVGGLFSRYNYFVAAAVIGILLGSMAESSLVHSDQISGGQLSYLLERPATLVIFALSLFSLLGAKLTAILTAKSKG